VEQPAVPDPGAAWVTPPGGLARRTARNAAVAAVAQIVGKVGTLVWTLIAARQLGEAAFGAFSFAFALAVLVSAVAEWGFDPVLVNRGSRTPERLSELFTLALTWELAVGVPVFALATGGAAVTEPGEHFRAALVVLMLSVLIDICSDTCRAASAARQSQAGTSLALVVQRIVTAAVAAVVLLAGANCWHCASCCWPARCSGCSPTLLRCSVSTCISAPGRSTAPECVTSSAARGRSVPARSS
jgi:O-antigen/teichoic acid export membrane protein